MPQISISPASILLTSGQTAVFGAEDETGTPLEASWRIEPALGKLTTTDGQPLNGPVNSIVYVAPPVQSRQPVTLLAEFKRAAPPLSAVGGPVATAATATISLTPFAVEILPQSVELGENEQQEFRAVVAGAPDTPVLWMLSPPIGKLQKVSERDQEVVGKIRYLAPETVDATRPVLLLASLATSAVPAQARVTLTLPPWTGIGVQALGAYGLAVFCLVFLLMCLWPPSFPTPDAARADRLEAERVLETRDATLRTADADRLSALELKRKDDQEEERQKEEATKRAAAPASATTAKSGMASPGADKAPTKGSDNVRTTPPSTAAGLPVSSTAPPPPSAAPAASAVASTAAADGPSPAELRYRNAEDARDRAVAARRAAQKELSAKQTVEAMVNQPDVQTWFGTISREIDLLCLVLVGGAIGGFLHLAQSFTEYVGNGRLKKAWAWWYAFRPFIGAALALVFYAALRGGFLAISSGSTGKSADLNPFGLVSIAALVGLFSRMATLKLSEVFDTLFRSANAKTKDQLDHSGGTPTGSAPPVSEQPGDSVGAAAAANAPGA